ncbi:hypothetical protein HK405_001677, partial [Cladochytrium tenue]
SLTRENGRRRGIRASLASSTFKWTPSSTSTAVATKWSPWNCGKQLPRIRSLESLFSTSHRTLTGCGWYQDRRLWRNQAQQPSPLSQILCL